MEQRILIVLGLTAAAVLAWWLAAHRRRRIRDEIDLPGYRRGRPAVLYFTAPGCGPCETIQRPALTRLEAAFGSALQVLEYDATLHPRLADSWGVLSVPTTFLIDADGRPRGVNHGPVRFETLLAQLARLGVSPEGLESKTTPALRRHEGTSHGTLTPRP